MATTDEKTEKPYTNISMRRELYERITCFLKTNRSYRSPTDFIEEATRLRLEELKESEEESD